MDNNHPIQGVMDTAMKNIKDMVDVNTIIGDPITTADGTVIIPVSKVAFGFASGGSDFTTKEHEARADKNDPLFAGGSGAGVTIQPIAFLVVSSSGGVSMLPVDQKSSTAVDRIVEAVPDLIEKAKSAFAKKEAAGAGE